MDPAGPDVTRIADLVRPVLGGDGRVRFGWLFGSRVTGSARPDSDVDLAVSVDPRGTLLDDAALHDRLAGALAPLDVDLLVLEDAPLWLQYRVVGGRVVHARDAREPVAHRERVEREFLDFRYYHDAYLAAVHERVRRGALSGG